MPLTPFIGLSVLVHIGIIVGYYFFRWIPKAKPRPSRIHPSVNRCLSFIIIFLVFVFVVTNATLLLKASLTSEYSSVKIASHYVSRALAYASSTITSDNNEGPVLEKIVNASEDRSATSCAKSSAQISALYNDSLVDYLRSKQMNSSFKNREIIAKGLGIDTYNGLAGENLYIFERLIKGFNDSGGVGCSP